MPEGVMTAALLELPVRQVDEAAARGGASGGRATLEGRLRETWRALAEHGTSECPLCRSRMILREAVGECGTCGTRLT
jgi:ribosomal protein L37AE/L43A